MIEPNTKRKKTCYNCRFGGLGGDECIKRREKAEVV